MTIDLPAYALGDQELWTPSLILNAHSFAERVFRAVPGRVGPRGDRAFWPEYAPDPDELTLLDDEEPLRPSRLDITRAEWVLIGFQSKDGARHPAWRNGALLGYPEQRRIFLRWSRWASYGKRTPDGVSETEEEFAERMRVSHAHLRRQRDFSAAVIARTLNEVELRVWYAEKPKRKNSRKLDRNASTN